MRVAIVGLVLLLGIGAASPGQATKVFIVSDPLTLERRTMVIEDVGPNRFYFCALPPATSGCIEIKPRRR